jgi:hypothetical protein
MTWRTNGQNVCLLQDAGGHLPTKMSLCHGVTSRETTMDFWFNFHVWISTADILLHIIAIYILYVILCGVHRFTCLSQ